MAEISQRVPLLGEERFLELIDHNGTVRMARFSYYSIEGGEVRIWVRLADGSQFGFHPLQMRDVRMTPAARDYWLGADHAGTRIQGAKKTHESQKTWLERMKDPDGVKGFLYGDDIFLQDESAFLIHPEVFVFNGATGTFDGARWVQDNLSWEFDEPAKKWLPVGEAAVSEAEIAETNRAIEGIKKSHRVLNRAGGELDVAFAVRLVRDQDVGATFYPWACLKRKDGTGLGNRKVIEVSQEFIATGRVTEFDVHEFGHAQTQRNLERGIPDPMAIQFVGINENPDLYLDRAYGKGFCSGYLEYFAADESRQYARSLSMSVHQKRNSEVLGLFQNSNAVPVWQVYGVNRDNFVDAMQRSHMELSFLDLFNERGRRFAAEAWQKLQLPDAHQEINLETGNELIHFASLELENSRIFIPFDGDLYYRYSELKTVASGRSGKLSGFLSEYLLNYVHALHQQKVALDLAKTRLQVLRNSPERTITLQEYLEFRDLLTRLISSVSAKPEHLGMFADLLPEKAK